MTPSDVRKELGLSITDMAQTLNIHRSTWNKWERGEQQPPAIAATAMRMLVFIKSCGLMESWNKINP